MLAYYHTSSQTAQAFIYTSYSFINTTSLSSLYLILISYKCYLTKLSISPLIRLNDPTVCGWHNGFSVDSLHNVLQTWIIWLYIILRRGGHQALVGFMAGVMVTKSVKWSYCLSSDNNMHTNIIITWTSRVLSIKRLDK